MSYQIRSRPLTPEELEIVLVDVKSLLSEHFELVAIYLFGSYGPGDGVPTATSDLDLLVVVRGLHPVDRHRVAYRALSGLPVRQSIRVYTSDDFDNRSGVSGLEQAVRSTGRLL